MFHLLSSWSAVVYYNRETSFVRKKGCKQQGKRLPDDDKTRLIAVTNQRSAVFLAPPLSIESVCRYLKRYHEKTGWWFLLLPLLTVEKQITVLMCNELNRTAWWKCDFAIKDTAVQLLVLLD